MIIILTKVMKMTDWETKARTIPNPENYFQGRTVADGFRLPASILIFFFFHDYPHEKTIISTRYMLILPTIPMECRVADSAIQLMPGGGIAGASIHPTEHAREKLSLRSADHRL